MKGGGNINMLPHVFALAHAHHTEYVPMLASRIHYSVFILESAH